MQSFQIPMDALNTRGVKEISDVPKITGYIQGRIPGGIAPRWLLAKISRRQANQK